MSKKQIKILIIVFLIVALIVFGIYLLSAGGGWINKNYHQTLKVKIDTKSNKDSKDNDQLKSKIETVNKPVKKKKEDLTSLQLKAVAKNFTERYGTWSTDNKLNNFDSARMYASSKMKKAINDFIVNNEKLSAQNSDYYGITSKALDVKIISFDDNSASLVVTVQKTETTGKELNKKTSYGSLNLGLIKSSSDWLVDSAEWKN